MKKIVIVNYWIVIAALTIILAIIFIGNNSSSAMTYINYKISQLITAIILLVLYVFSCIKEQIKWIKIFEDKIQIKTMHNLKSIMTVISRKELKKCCLRVYSTNEYFHYYDLNICIEFNLSDRTLSFNQKGITITMIKKISDFLQSLENYSYDLDLSLDNMPKSRNALIKILNGDSKALLLESVYNAIMFFAGIIGVILMLFILLNL